MSVVTRGAESKKKLLERGVTPGKISSEITKREKGSTKRVTTDPQGNIKRVEETINTPEGKVKKTTFYSDQEQKEEIAIDKKAVRNLNEQLSRQGINTAEDFVEGLKSGRIVSKGDTLQITNQQPTTTTMNNRFNNNVPYFSRGDNDDRQPNNNYYVNRSVLLLSKQQDIYEQEKAAERERIKRFEERIAKSKEREERFRSSQGFRNIQETSRFITFGGKKKYEERSFVGKTTENVVTNLLSWPLVIGGTAANIGEKVAATGEGLSMKATRKSTIKEYGRAATSKELKDTFNPRTPEGASTYATAILFAPFGANPKNPAAKALSRYRLRTSAPKTQLPSAKTTTTYVPFTKEVIIEGTKARTVIETVPFKQKAPGYEISRSRSIFETATKERQLALREGGKDPFTERGVKTPVDEIISPLQRAQRQPGQTRLVEYGLKNPLNPESRYLLRYKEAQARQLSLRETQYTVPECGSKVTEKGFVEFNIPKPRVGPLGKSGQSRLGFGRQGSYKSSFQDYYTLRIQKPSFSVESLVPKGTFKGGVYRGGLLFNPYQQKSFSASSLARPSMIGRFQSPFVNTDIGSAYRARFTQLQVPVIDSWYKSGTRSRLKFATLSASASMAPNRLVSIFDTPSKPDIIKEPKTGFSKTKPSEPFRTRLKPPTGFPRLKDRLRGGYSLEVRQQGRFKTIGNFKELSSAATKGYEITEGTAAASLRVKNLSTGGYEDVSRLLGGRYYASKKDPFTFIEKKQYRISTGGEKSQITAKGIAASKKRRRTF